MDESEENMIAEDINNDDIDDSPVSVKIKPKKRSLVERELETNLTARVTSPVTGEGSSTSRYGRARRIKTASEIDADKIMKPLKVDVSKQPQAYKMHASNSPINKESPKRTISVGSSIEDQIENIYNENISLSRFGSVEKTKSQSPAKKFSKIYIRKDLIQKPDTDTAVLIKNMFSPNKSNSHLNNILERSSEKYSLNGHGKAMNGFPDTSSVVKTLDFDGKKKNKQVSPAQPIKKEVKEKITKELKEKVIFKDIKEKLVSKEVKEKLVSKNELFELEATCEYQVGDLAWARVGTYPFWPCIVTREPFSDMFVKKKLFGRVERSVIHVTFFGDNGRRGWIVDNMLRKFHGRAEFEACRNKFTPESKKKDPRLYAAHFVSEKKLPLWNVSVEEAETLMKEPKRLRIDALYDMLEKARAAKTTPSKRDKGGKITRTDSDVSLSESLYDTLFSEDDGKQDDNRSKRARNKSLDVSEVVTACLDNMAARSGIIQIQRQSHMDRWLQKAKSKTPEKMQPKLHIKVERGKRKDKAKKKKEGKNTHKTRKNESLGSDTNLLPYQNEHDYSSVNYENHDINDSSNKNIDSASGLDSTLDTSTTISDVGVTVKIENISSSMEDCSQEDIITSIVNDDIVMTDSVNISKDETRNNVTNRKDNINNIIKNNNEHILDTGNKNNNEFVEIKEELPLKNCDLTNTIHPRRSKRKRQTFEGINNSITEKKAKEPKLDLHNQKPNEETTTPKNAPKSNNNQESKLDESKETEDSEKTEMANNLKPTIENVDKETSLNIKIESTDAFPDQSKLPVEPLNNSANIAQFESSNQEPEPQLNSDVLTVETAFAHAESEKCVKEACLDTITNDRNISTIRRSRRSKEKHDAKKTKNNLKEKNNEVESTDRMASDSIPRSVVDNISLNTDTDNNIPTEIIFEQETSLSNSAESNELISSVESHKEAYAESDKCVKGTCSTTITNDRDISTIRRSRRSKEKHDAKKIKNDSKENNKVESTDRMACDSIPKSVVDNVPLNSDNTDVFEKEASLNSSAESTELISCVSSISKPVVDIKPLNSENAVTGSNETPTINLEKETSQDTRVESKEICSNKPKDEIKNKPLSSEITVTESNVPTVKNIEEETSKNRKLESTEPMPCNSKSKPVVVIEPLNFVNTILESNTATEETSKNSKPEARELTLFNNKSKPVVVIEPLNCENIVECNPPIIANLEKETSQNNKLESMELIAFHKSSKPVVVIEPLDMQGLETQFIIKGSTPLVRNRSVDSLNKKDNIEDKSETTSVLSDLVQNDVCNAFKDNDNTTEVSSAVDEVGNVNTKPETDTASSSQYTYAKPKKTHDVLKNRHQETEISFDDSERMEGDDFTTHVVDEDPGVTTSSIPCTELAETVLDPSPSIEIKTIEVPIQPVIKIDDEILKNNVQTNVVIGEETYIFDRTLSQDYDEIDGDCYDEYSHLPQVIINEETEKAILIQNTLISNQKISSQESCTDKINNSTEKISSLSNDSGPEIVKNDSQIQGNCIFLDKRNIHNDSEIVEDPEVPTGDVSSIAKEENNCNEVTQDNNDKCVFLDQRSKTADAQSADNIEKKMKSSRFSLNRTRNRSLKLNKVNTVLESSKISIAKVNTESGHLKPASVISNENEMSISSKRRKSDPEFVKYMVIRQDALLDEQPDLTQDEIVTYLYKNWLYEEEKKSDMKKMDDNEQASLVKGFQKSQQPKKVKRKSKLGNVAELKNVDIRKILNKGKTKSFPDQSELANEPLYNSEHDIASCEGSYQEPEPHRNNVIQTVESNRNPHTEPQKNVKKASSVKEVSIANDNDLSTIRHSRRSEDKRDTKTALNELKEKLEDKCVVKIASINTTDSKVSTTRTRLRLSKDKLNINPILNTSPEKCFIETTQTSSNDIGIPSTNRPDQSKQKEDTKRAMDDPEFMKYLEIHQDNLLDEQLDLTQDELYNKSKQLNLVNNQNSENNKHSGLIKDELDIVQITDSEKNLLEMASSNDSEISILKEEKNAKETISTEPEISQMNSNDSLMSTKPTGRTKEKQDTKKAINDPEFIKYLEIHQDALLDEQPDLTQDEIVNYLYQNWLYEEGNKSEMKKIDDNEQSNLVKGLNHFPVPLKKIKKKSKVEKAPESKNADIRRMFHKEISKSASGDIEISSEKGAKEINKNNLPEHRKTSCGKIENGTHESNVQNIDKLNNIVDSDSLGRVEALTLKENTSDQNSDKILKNFKDDSSEKLNNRTEEAKKNSEDFDDIEFGLDELEGKDNEDSKESAHCKIINGFIDFEESSKSKTHEGFDPETASIKSEDSAVSATTRKARKEKDAKKSMDDPDFLKYLEARQDALIDEQPDLTREEIVTYLYQTWFYEESTKSDMKKNDETEQSNLVKGLNQEPPPEPKKIKKRPKVEKESVEKVKSTEVKDIKVEKSEKVLKNADIRDMIQKPKRKATQSKPYYNEDDSDLEEEDLETFKIFDRDEPTEDGEEIDEVELYFEQLTKPKPNVFKGYVRERVCEICYRAGSLVKCKSCHGTYHVECVKKEAEVTEVAGPTRGRKRKRGRKPKGYDRSLDTGSQSDERSQDANNSEEINISIEDEAESHIVFDEDNFETLWENKMKELQTDTQDDYVSDQEIDWEVEPGHCEIVELKHKEKPIDYSDYKCNNCLKYETPVCFVCKSNKSPKALTEVRQKCQVAHCHRYYHLECLDHWPQTQFNSWEPSKTNKKQIEYIEALSCPRHVCHTCVSDDPRGCKTRFCGDKLARCVKCPATYHSYTKCLPAGSQILTGSQIICPRHYEHRPGKVPCHVNTGWCFICALGGTLICCEYCPTSFHAECLNIKPPEGSYMCEDCETGRLPLYGEMVWVKLGHYRWWPGIVLHPTEIPDNILAVKHSQGEFVVRFFGQYDHYWVNRGRVFPFQEGDSGRISSQKSKIDAAFTTAMEHAQRACEILKKMEPNEEEDLDIASSLLPPHYVKLKVNKPAGNVVRRDVDANSLTQCDCDPNQPDPCGLYSHCLNRMLLTECGPLCRAGERCHNRAFERRQYPRLQAYRTPHRGWGLRTLQDIKQGQFVIEYVGELIDMEEFRRRMCRKHEIRDENFYFLTLDKERMIDAGPKGNLARFMNHCCEPNCETQKWTVLGDVRVGLFALYDIPANTEVTFNYNLECAGIEKKRCLCGAKRCSGYIGAKPKQLQEDKPKLPKRTYKKRKPVEETKPKLPKIKIKPIKPRELTEIEKDLLIIKNATNGMSSDSEGSRLSVDDKNPKALKRKRVSFSTDELSGKKAKLESEVDAV